MKKLLIIFLTVLAAGTLPAQQPDEASKRALEHEVKGKLHNYLYSDYLYGEAVADTKSEAVKMAKSDLLSQINKEALKHPEWQFAKTIKADSVEYDTDMIDLMRGRKFRVIAYIKKDNITTVFDNNTPKIKISDKPETPKTGSQTTVQPVKQQTEQPAPPMPPVEPSQSATPVDREQLQSAPVVAPPSSGSLKHKADGLLGEILNAASCNEILKILDANKGRKAAYGKMEKLTSPEKAYLVVYKSTGEIVAILDKGSRNNRKDLLSDEVKGEEIQTQNQVIWFQLF
ncbi:MAG: hypothetical protein LBD45_03545 [Bacteroidales bacterium]|jgi:hypothetical protein|nr:hypothetical protein [Bacteroidales bacterium]